MGWVRQLPTFWQVEILICHNITGKISSGDFLKCCIGILANKGFVSINCRALTQALRLFLFHTAHCRVSAPASLEGKLLPAPFSYSLMFTQQHTLTYKDIRKIIPAESIYPIPIVVWTTKPSKRAASLPLLLFERMQRVCMSTLALWKAHIVGGA